MKNKKYSTPKYPRIMVSPARHKKLAAEAKKKSVSLMELAEEKFKAAK